MINFNQIQNITASQAKSKLDNGAILVDVREPDELDSLAYDTPNQINIPLSEFVDRFSEISKDQSIILACQSGNRSYQALGFLINQGYSYENIANLNGGVMGWIQAGLPFQTNRKAAGL